MFARTNKLKFLAVIFICLAIFASWVFWEHNSPGRFPAETTTVIIPQGSGFSGSVHLLAENNVLAHPLIFKIIAYATGDAKKVKAGEYLFPVGISPREILQMLVAGKVVTHKITIPEGLNVREVREMLMAEPTLDGEFQENIGEGTLLPETYYFTRGDSRAAIVSRMQEQMKKMQDGLWEKRAANLPFKTMQEAAVLASIIEKETGIKEERPRVAAIFVNRLRLGMKLQSDPTTVYGIEKITGKKMEKPLTLSDLKTPSAYNTYTIDALPPEPICNFGAASFLAAINPMVSDELYFVATGNGGHNFAKTMKEHEKNVQLYRQTKKADEAVDKATDNEYKEEEAK